MSLGDSEEDKEKPTMSDLPHSDSTQNEKSAKAEQLDFEREFREKNPLMWWGALVGPALMELTILVLYFLVYGPDGIKNLAIAIVATFLLFGRFVILFGGDPIEFSGVEFQMSSEALFVMVTTMDFLVAFFVAFHMGILFRLPFFGPKLEGMVSDGRFILQHQPWIRNIAFFGLVLFVIFPSSTTGSIGGSIFGRLLGMRRTRVVTAILIGSVLGNGLMYVLAGWISQYVSKDNIWLKLGGVIFMVVVLVIVERYFRKMKAKYEELDASSAKSS